MATTEVGSPLPVAGDTRVRRSIGTRAFVRHILADELAPLLDREVAPNLFADEVGESLERGYVHRMGQVP